MTDHSRRRRRRRRAAGYSDAGVEAALRAFLAQARRQGRDARDLDIPNRRAERLNLEAADVLTYQVIPITSAGETGGSRRSR